MKTLIACLLMSSAAFSGTLESLNSSCSQEELKLAERLLEIKTIKYRNGFATRTEVLDKTILVLDTKMCSSQISKDDYCLQKAMRLEELVEIRTKLFDHGMITQQIVDEALAIEATHNQTCRLY